VTEYLGQPFDYVVTVCDEARLVCPVFPGVHQSLHWGYEDPAEAGGTDPERLVVFRRVFIQLGERVNQFVPLALRQRRERREAASAPTGG
jgi:arsenate reductase